MKTTGIFLFALILSLHSVAQTWKIQIESVSGHPRTRTLRLQPKYSMTVGSVLEYSDSVKKFRYYEGLFKSGSRDSIDLKLSQVREELILKNGIRENTRIPAGYYLSSMAPGKGVARIALPDVAFLESRNKELGGWSEIGEPIMLLSILTMIAAPFICYDYKDGGFNSDRYKYWAVGGSIGIATGFTTIFTFSALSNHKKLKFHENWNSKGNTVWKFKR